MNEPEKNYHNAMNRMPLSGILGTGIRAWRRWQKERPRRLRVDDKQYVIELDISGDKRSSKKS